VDGEAGAAAKCRIHGWNGGRDGDDGGENGKVDARVGAGRCSRAGLGFG
jgi:hypothetical protein